MKNRISIKNKILGLFIFICGIIIDQVTKFVIVKELPVGNSIEVIKGFFYIAHSKNDGAAWGILRGQSFFLVGVTFVAIVICFYIMMRSERLLFTSSLALMASGGIGNLIDRVFRGTRLFKGSVVDFLDFYIFGYDFPVFNVADMCVVTGAIMFMVFILFIYKDGDRIMKPIGFLKQKGDSNQDND